MYTKEQTYPNKLKNLSFSLSLSLANSLACCIMAFSPNNEFYRRLQSDLVSEGQKQRDSLNKFKATFLVCFVLKLSFLAITRGRWSNLSKYQDTDNTVMKLVAIGFIIVLDARIMMLPMLKSWYTYVGHALSMDLIKETMEICQIIMNPHDHQRDYSHFTLWKTFIACLASSAKYYFYIFAPILVSNLLVIINAVTAVTIITFLF